MFFFRNNDQELTKKGVRNAFLAFAYVAGVVMTITSFERMMGPDKEDGLLAPMVGLMLLVLSAAVMGMLFFGAPVMLYIDGKKKEAVRLLMWTVGVFAMLTLLMIMAMTFVSA